MPTLADIRAKLPDLQGLDDEQAISVIQQVYYPTVPVEQIAARLGYKPAASAALPERTKLAAVNDTVIEAANAVAGGVGSIANFVAPGNRVSSFIDENIVKPGQESQSDRKKAINARLAQDIAGAQGVGDQVGAALRYAKDDPAGLLGMAAGSFAIPLGAIKGAGMLAKSLGVVDGAATKAALAGGALTGAALSGGDAAGQAYEESLKAGATEEQAQAAARQASVIPAIVGGAGGMLGAERIFAGAKGFKGNAISRALKTGASEGAQEFGEEFATQYEANRAVAPYDGRDPMQGAVAAGTLGALAGAPIGMLTGAVSPRREDEPKKPAPTPEQKAASLSPEQTQGLLTHAEQRLAALERKAQGQKGQTVTGFDGKPVKMDDVQPEFLTPEEQREIKFLKAAGKDADKLANGYPGLAQKLAPAPRPTPEQAAASVLAAGSVDEAIKAASDATSGKAAGGGLDRLRGILPDEQRREVIGLMATANNPNSPPNVRRFAEQQIDAILREYTDIPTADVLDEAEMLPTPDATELTDEERAAYVNAPSNLDRLRLRKPIPTGEATDAIPAADAQEIEPIPAGDASEEIPAPDAYEVPPIGEATEVIPTGDAMEVPRIPTGKATEIEPEVVEPTDLTTTDGMPYGSKTAANVRARREGLGPANVIEIPGAGWVVRPQPKTLGPEPIQAQPAGTRGTNAGDVVKAAPKPADSDAEENAFRTGDFKAMLRLRKERQAKERAAAGDLNDGGILKHQKDDRWVMVLPDVEGAGKWRIQRFDKRGFSGHMVFNSRDEAIEAALGEGFKVRDDAAMDAMQDTPEFQRGNFAADLIRRLNGNEITREEADRQLAEYDAPKKAPDDANPARTAGPRPADAGRGDGAGVLRDQPAGDVAGGAAAPAGQGVDGGGAAGPGAGGRDKALTPGRVMWQGREFERETVAALRESLAAKLADHESELRTATLGKKRGDSKVARALRQNVEATRALLAQADKALAGAAQEARLAPAQQNLQDRLSDARRIGKEAAERGEPRDPPQAFTGMEKQVWRAGWDQGRKIGGPTPQVPALDAAEKPRKTLQEGRTDAALDRQVREDGEITTRRQWVERKVAEGLKTRITQEDRIKPMSRMAYFRATNEEQREHERKIKAGGKKDVYWIGDYEVTKIEHDYAARLTAAQAAPPPAKQGPTAEGATDEGLQGQGQGRREEVAAGAQAEVPAPTVVAPAPTSEVSTSAPMNRLGNVMRRAGWEIDYIDLDLTAEQPKADVRINRGDGRFIIAKVDAQGRATMETFQRTRSLGIDPKNKQARLAPQIDDQFLGRQKFEGARSMLRGMVNYLTDNATNPVALADMKAAWAGVMAGPTDAAPALPAPTLAERVKQRRGEKGAARDTLTATPLSGVELSSLAVASPPAPSRTARDGRMEQLDAEEMEAEEAREATIRRLTEQGVKPTRESVGQKRRPAEEGGGYVTQYQWRLKDGDDRYLELTDAERDRLLASPLARSTATHKDPGQPAEPATAPVIAQALSKAAVKEALSRAAMKAEALRLVDAAIATAKDADDPDVRMYEATAPGTRMTEEQIAQYKRLQGQAREKYMKRLTEEMAAQHERAAQNIGYAKIKVPGDGEFKVLNTKERLAEFRKKVESSPGFKETRAPRAPVNSANSKADAFSAMVEDGDLQAALDYAQAVGIDPKTAKLTDVLRKRLDKFMRDEEMAAAVAAREPAAPAPAPQPEVDAAPAAEPVAEAPAPVRDEPKIELRKRLSVLRSLKDCLA